MTNNLFKRQKRNGLSRLGNNPNFNDMCYCGSGKKYGKCCARYEKVDHVALFLFRAFTEIKLRTIITKKNGSNLTGFKETVSQSSHGFLFDVINEKAELDKCLNNWESYSRGKIKSRIIPRIKDIANDSDAFIRADCIEGNFKDIYGKLITGIQSMASPEIYDIGDVTIAGPLDIYFYSKSDPQLSVLDDLVFGNSSRFYNNPENFQAEIRESLFESARNYAENISSLNLSNTANKLLN